MKTHDESSPSDQPLEPRAVGSDESGQGLRYPIARLRVAPWADPMLDRLGHDPRSPYVERFWTAILGPSSTLLLRRLAMGLDRTPQGFEIDVEAWAHELGIGIRGGRNSPFWRAVERTGRFRATRLQGDTLYVRRRLDTLNLRQIERLPPHLQRAHRAWSSQRLLEHRPDAA